MNDNRPIGIFDSGLGGLTVVSAIKKKLPNENIIYYGDTKHLPYGDKSKETIEEYSTRITNFLLNQNCKMIVVACNSASSNALNRITETANTQAKVIDVISPITEKVAFEIQNHIGIIATKATVRSGVYQAKIKKHNRHVKVSALATPLFVPIIEEGFLNSEVSRAAIASYLSNNKLKSMDCLILGCTHYPLIQNEIDRYFNGNMKIIDTPTIVANTVKRQLENQDKLGNSPNPDYHFYLSDLTKNFAKLSKKFFGSGIILEQNDIHLAYHSEMELNNG